LPELEWLKKSDYLQLWKKWGGALREDLAPPTYGTLAPGNSTRFSNDKGKKRKSISEIDNQPNIKHFSILTSPIATSSHAIPLTSNVHVDNVSEEPMSISEILFNHQISELMSGDESDDCKSPHFVQTLPSSNNPIFMGQLVYGRSSLLDLLVLVDSGASILFISDSIIDKHHLKTNQLTSPFRICSFNGLLAVSGDVTCFIDCKVLIPLRNQKFLESSVCFHVTRLSSADAIFGSTWLKATNNLIGGVDNDVIIHGRSVSNCSIDSSPSQFLLTKFSDVFVSDGLAVIPPH
jgi:hypothetical protein